MENMTDLYGFQVYLKHTILYKLFLLAFIQHLTVLILYIT